MSNVWRSSLDDTTSRTSSSRSFNVASTAGSPTCRPKLTIANRMPSVPAGFTTMFANSSTEGPLSAPPCPPPPCALSCEWLSSASSAECSAAESEPPPPASIGPTPTPPVAAPRTTAAARIPIALIGSFFSSASSTTPSSFSSSWSNRFSSTSAMLFPLVMHHGHWNRPCGTRGPKRQVAYQPAILDQSRPGHPSQRPNSLCYNKLTD